MCKINKEKKEIETLVTVDLQARLEKDLSTGFWIYLRTKPAPKTKAKDIKDFEWMFPLSNPFDIYEFKTKEELNRQLETILTSRAV